LEPSRRKCNSLGNEKLLMRFALDRNVRSATLLLNSSAAQALGDP